MNNKSIGQFLLPGAFLLLILGGCSDGGDSATGAAAPSLPLLTGVFTKDVPSTAGSSSSGLLTADNSYAHWQLMYLPGEIQATGNISAISVQYNSDMAVDVSCPNLTIRLGHNDLADLTTTFASNIETGKGGMLTVLSDATVTFPAGTAGSIHPIWLTTPFAYNGVDNLVVEIERSSACSATVNDRIREVPYQGTAWSFTSGSLSASTATSVSNIRLVFAGGDDRLVFAGADSSSWPFANTAESGSERPRVQNLYLASEINGSGPITGIAFQTSETTVAGTYTYSVKLGHSALTALTTNYADNYAGTAVTVANGVAFTVSAHLAAGEWIWIPIPQGAFTYNGTDNLIVEVETSAGDAPLYLRTANSTARRLAVNNVDGMASSGTIEDVAYHIALRFNGGTMDVNPLDITASDALPFWNNAGARQWLYLAQELGTKGVISKLACRNNYTTSTAQSFNYTIVMSHHADSALVTTRAANLPVPVTVFAGTINMPAGVQAGDYFEIPLTSSFAYNGKDNLVIDISGTGTGSGFACGIDNTSMLYANRRAWDDGAGPNAVTMNVITGLPVMRFTISR